MDTTLSVIDAEDEGGLGGSSLPELIYRQLRQDILNGILKPGEQLKQEELAKRLKSSRVPVREAMSRLEADGFVSLRPRRGYAVTSLDERDIVEVFELRMVVESHAGHIAAYAHTEEDVRHVGQLLKQMAKLDTRKPQDLSEWLKLNYEFHSAIIGSARRKRLSRVAGLLRDTVEPYIRVEVQMTGDVHAAHAEHLEMFEAFRAGDAKGLAEICRNHVQGTERRLLDGLRSRRIQADSSKNRKTGAIPSVRDNTRAFGG